MTTTTTLKKWGNCVGIRIPKLILDNLSLNSEDQVSLNLVNDSVIIKKINKWSPEIQHNTISDIISFLNTADNEPLPDNFSDICCNDNNTNDLNFEALTETCQ